MDILEESGKNGFDGTLWTVQGFLQFARLSRMDVEKLRPFDSIRDMGGRGSTVYVHQCRLCGKKFWRGMMALVEVRCSDFGMACPGEDPMEARLERMRRIPLKTARVNCYV